MAYLTEKKLASISDIPISLPATEIKQGDWLVLATTRIVSPMLLTVRYMSLQLISANVSITDIAANNRVYGNLGLVYIALRRDYTGGDPGASGGLETLVATSTGIVSRDTATPLELTTPGNYSWILANNMKADSAVTIPATTSIDFKVCINGQARIDLSNVQ